MITVVTGAPFLAYVTGAPSGLAGTIGARIVDVLGNEVLARTVEDIMEIVPDSGVYKWLCPGLPRPGSCLIMWDTGGSAPTFTVEELKITALPPAALPAAVVT